ncbi:universal stress protein YxiE-like [Babylonia areolata]|uniref:universal stress protein YxiE-like n=1 Tax=Babylonia areolata TaxID=304850 RepID=UPI003FD1B000
MSERKILIPVDGSKSSEQAFKWYLDNMRSEKDVVILMHVPEYHVSMGFPGKAADVEAITKGMKVENERIENMIGNHMEELKKNSVRGYKVVKSGMKPGEAISKQALEEGANAIIMGSRGLGVFRRTLMGSVSDYVAQHAPPNCAVTIVRESS